MRCVLLLSLVACAVPPPKVVDDSDQVDTDPPQTDTFVLDTDVDDTGTPVDTDGDGVFDADDLCPTVYDDQTDSDGDLVGDACDEDRDGDNIPDDVDRWPDDGDFPALANGEKIYAHTATELYVLQLQTSGETLDRVGAFTFDAPVPSDRSRHEVTDIAIDRIGQLFAITWSEIFLCHPVTAACRKVGTLPDSSNGLTFVPGPTTDRLLGMSGADIYELDVSSSVVVSRPVGVFEPGCSGTCAKASGDAFSIEGVGTFATVYGYDDYTLYDQLVELDPSTGNILREVTRFTGSKNQSGSKAFRDVWGLAAWNDGYFYGFAETGQVLKIDVAAQDYSVLFNAGVAWWGAGVRTIIPPQP